MSSVEYHTPRTARKAVGATTKRRSSSKRRARGSPFHRHLETVKATVHWTEFREIAHEVYTFLAIGQFVWKAAPVAAVAVEAVIRIVF